MDSEIENFLDDVSQHLKNNLQSFDYQNTLKNTTELSNDEQQSRILLERCEKLLNYLKLLSNNKNVCLICNCDKKKFLQNENNNEINDKFDNNILHKFQSKVQETIDESSYLDMSANRKTLHNDYMAFTGPSLTTTSSSSFLPNNNNNNNNNNNDLLDNNNSLSSSPLFSTNIINKLPNSSATVKRSTISMIECLDSDSDKDNYDICNVQELNQSLKERRQTTSFITNQHHQRSKSLDENEPILDCPYIGLPASHLIIHKSPKFGQLVRIEKRLFFDQTKKYYCGILNDWLLCYNTDSTTSNNMPNSNSNSNSNNSNNSPLTNPTNSSLQIRPVICIQLSGTEIEHYGEGKRRDLCFQITNIETTKKFIFQSINEIETKEWIHAIEAAIRGDFYQQNRSNNNSSPKSPSSIDISFNNSLRKLPTPPVQNKNFNLQHIEDIYEEPCSLYQIDLNQSLELKIEQNVKNLDEIPPDIPLKLGKLKIDSSNNGIVEYDIPKVFQKQQSNGFNELNDKIEIKSSTVKQIEQLEITTKNKTDFQNKFKDVHNKLTNQFSKVTTTSPINDTKFKKNKKLQKIKNNELQSQTNQTNTNNNNNSLIGKKLNVTTNGNSKTTSLNVPVKNWFLTRLNKGSSFNGNSISPKLQSIQKSNSPEIESLLDDNVKCTVNDSPAKSGKVNMIINQLEANGHLPIISQKFDRYNKSLLTGSTTLNIYDDCSYEPMMASD